MNNHHCRLYKHRSEYFIICTYRSVQSSKGCHDEYCSASSGDYDHVMTSNSYSYTLLFFAYNFVILAKTTDVVILEDVF